MMSQLTNKFLKTLLIFLIPIIIVLGSVRVLTTDAYLTFEYGKESFPSDLYGFTPKQRFILASTNIHYVRAHLPNDELSKQNLNGTAIFSDREIAHMADVQTMFQFTLRVWQFAFILFIFLAVVLWKKGEQTMVTTAVRQGGLLTSVIILMIGLLAVFAWQAWFEMFHRLFFESGSWLFSYTDTLIRLFPIEFWFDSMLTISILSFVGGSLLALLGWRGQIMLARLPAGMTGTNSLVPSD